MTQGISPFSTYDQNPPVLPSGQTFNDCANQDDTSDLPLNPLTDPNSEEYNYLCSDDIAFATMMASAKVSVLNAAVTWVLSPRQVVNGNLSAFSLTNAVTGKYVLEWTSVGTNSQTGLPNPANQMLPPQRANPEACFTGTLGANTYAISAAYVTGPTGNPAVQVPVVINGALANLPRTIGVQVSMF